MSIGITLAESYWEGVDAGVQALVDSWLVAEGAAVQAGQALVRVVLIKTSIDVEAPTAGTLERIEVPAGENFARGQALGRLRPA